MFLLAVILIASCIGSLYGYLHVPTSCLGVAPKANIGATGAPTITERIQAIIATNKVVLFMKGEKERPQW